MHGNSLENHKIINSTLKLKIFKPVEATAISAFSSIFIDVEAVEDNGRSSNKNANRSI